MSLDRPASDLQRFKSKAREVWDELTDDDLARMDGDREQLIEAVRARYSMTHRAAEREVNAFFERHDIAKKGW